MYSHLYDETLLCAVQLDLDVVVMLAPNSFDFLTCTWWLAAACRCRCRFPADVNVLHLYKAFVVFTNALTTLRRLVSSTRIPRPDADPHYYLLCTEAPSNWWMGFNGKFTNNVQCVNKIGWQNSSTQVPELQVRVRVPKICTGVVLQYKYEYRVYHIEMYAILCTRTQQKRII